MWLGSREKWGSFLFYPKHTQSHRGHVLVNFLEAVQFSLCRQAGALSFPVSRGLERSWGRGRETYGGCHNPKCAQKMWRRGLAAGLGAMQRPGSSAVPAMDLRWTPPALAGCNPDLEAWSLVWGPFPKDAQFQRRLGPSGPPRLRPAGGGRAGESEGAPAEFAAGLAAGGGSLQAQSEQKLQPRVAECAGRPGMGWVSTQEFPHLQWAPTP